jgi:endonuclease-3
MKNQNLLKKIQNVNSLLVAHFGVPPRNKMRAKPLDMLIATILSQNTNDKNSFQAYMNLRQRYKTWADAEKDSLVNIEATIRIAGLANQKAKTIKNILTDLKNRYHKFSLDHLENLPDFEIINILTNYEGVGVKTASCVLLFSMHRNICPVDTHVHRTLNRIGLVDTKTPDKTFVKLNFNFPEGIAHSFHTNLIRFGREICLAQSPKCFVCPIKSVCKFKSKTRNTNSDIKEKRFMLLDNV